MAGASGPDVSLAPVAARGGNRTRWESGAVPGMSALDITTQELQPQPEIQWKETRRALERLAETLSCSLCSNILKKPVNLGGCEHVFCLTCVESSIGTICPICQIPSMKRDMKINRKIENIIELYSKLQGLKGPGESPLALEKSVGESESKKTQIQMRFSPRSRKMRFTVKKSPKKAELTKPVSDFTSIYDFVSSPPNQEPSRKEKKPQQERKQKRRKKSFTDLNKQRELLRGKQENSSSRTKESLNKSKEPTSSSGSKNPPRVRFAIGSELAKNENEDSLDGDTFEKDVQKSSNGNISAPSKVAGKSLTSDEDPPSARETARLKCGGSPTASPNFLSRHCRKKELISNRTSLKETPRRSPRSLLRKVSPATDCVISSSPLPPTNSSSLKKDFRLANCQVIPEMQLLPSNCTKKEAQETEGFSRKSPNSISAKRNHKGETLLHTASIEGDISAVECLLKNGADPNVKDNAGWTPLHEACNHGHTEVAELLLRHGALLNVTGYQNELPLHDAVKNGHTEVVELLLLHGASRDAVNIFGHKPVDYAETEKMKSLLTLHVKNDSSSFIQYKETVSLIRSKNESVVLLGSSLDSSQKRLLIKLAAALKGRICPEFNSSVTHVVVPAGPVRSTVKCMLAVLTGCWILSFTWVEDSLKKGAWEQEDKYEIGGGPQQGRLNKEQLLPKLFDGCYFYFLGVFRGHKKDDLKELVTAGGGQILKRKPKSDNDVTQTINTVAYHAEITSDHRFCTQYIIYDASSDYRPEKIRQGKVWEAPSRWLLDCVMSFQLLPLKK